MILTDLRPYQAEALRRWDRKPSAGFGLFMEQRTGKTLTALAIVDHVRPTRLLIVTVVKGLTEWETQLETHLKIDWPCEIQTFTFGEVANPRRRKRLRKWLSVGNTMVIADESQRIKRRGSKWSRAARSLAHVATHRLALTGTPVGQGVHDVWAQFDFIDPEIFGPWSAFADRFCIMGGYKGKKVVGHQNLEEFKQILHQNSYRVTLREAQREAGESGFKIRRVTRHVELDRAELGHYEELERDLVTHVQQNRIEVPLLVSLVIKLQQVTGGFLIHEGQAIRVGNSKLTAFARLVQELPSEPLVICVRFTHELEAIRHLGDQLGKRVQTISGEGNFFTLDSPPDWIIIQVQSGVAIDLSVATRVIFYSWDYSYLNYEQLRFRILHFKARVVTYYYLVAKNTIDEVVLETVTRKRKLSTAVFDKFRRRSPCSHSQPFVQSKH